MTTTWKITNINRVSFTGLVIEVTYMIIFEIEGTIVRHVGICQLTGDPQDSNFIPFNYLTENVVIDWVKNDLGVEKIDEIMNTNENILNQIISNEKKSPHISGLPW
jgi:hypothetical protein